MDKPESPLPDEMLSAFLDAELSPSEHQQVEAALQQDEQLRALLSDLKQIRAEIRSLPKHALSPEFTSRVVQRCSETKPKENDNHTRAASVPRVRRDSMMKIAIGVGVTAATLLIGIWTFGPRNAPVQLATAPAAEDLVEQAVADQEAAGRQDFPAASELKYAESSPAPSVAPDVDHESFQYSMQPAQVDTQRDANLARFGVVPLDGSVRGASPQMKERSLQEDSGFDAVVRVSLPQDQLAAYRGRQWFSQEQLAQFQVTSRAELSERESEDLSALKLDVPDDAKLILIEGTRAEIATSFSELNAAPTSISLKRNVDVEALGLPVVEALAVENADRGLDVKDRATDVSEGMTGQTLKPSATSTRFRSTFSDADVEHEDTMDAGKQVAGASRYRVLVIVEPTKP